MLKLHNTLSKEVEEFKPIDDQNIRVYSCGPTVYDHAHIGNLASYIFADTLRRVLTVSGYSVTQVMNYTDVDDKTIRRSLESYPKLEPRQALEELTSHYTELFLDDMKRIGNDINGVTFMRATDHIEAMKQLIAGLHDKDFAYIAEDGVYFSVEAYKSSGKIYGQLLKIDSENTSQARIQNDEYDKASAHDFALWKTQKEGEPAWEFELGGKNLKGRPGWHVECSAMSRQILGQPFDIHTGGVDLIFPHHENEIAQSTASGDPSLATMFVHNEHILVDGKKMSKSLNNFYTLDDIIAKGFDPLAFRLLVLQSHYRNQVHFSWENLQAAQNRLVALRNFAALRWQTSSDAPLFYFDKKIEQIKDCIQNNLNTVDSLTVLSEVENRVAENLVHPDSLASFVEFLTLIDSLLGLKLSDSPELSSEQLRLIDQRHATKANKDFAKSDEIREALKQQGIGVRDTGFGQVWYRIDVV